MIPQMKLAAHNNSNPTLLVSGIPEQTSQHQENIGISNCNDTMDNQLFTSSLLPPQVRTNYINRQGSCVQNINNDKCRMCNYHFHRIGFTD